MRIIENREQHLTVRPTGLPSVVTLTGTKAGLTRRTSRMRPTRNSAFTLVEMLLVLVILATLAAIVYPRVMGHSREAQITAARTQISSFGNAIRQFDIDNGHIPMGRNGLNDLMVKPRDCPNWHGPYLETDVLPKDPWQQDYVYECPGRHNPSTYDLYSKGPPNENLQIGNWTAQNH